MRQAMDRYLYLEKEKRFARMINFRKDGSIDIDATVDASLYGIFAFGTYAVVCGAGTGGSPPARLHQIFFRQLEVIGSTLSNRAEYREVWRALDQGTIRPVVDCVLPFADIHRAHARVEAGEQMGKVVLEL